MKLFFRKFGQGQPLIILHGLFGQSDNWNTLAKQFASSLEVYGVDLRNHGLSPHSDEWTYPAMSADIAELIVNNSLKDVILLGHSLGGKVAMQLASEEPTLLQKLIVADISPRDYPGGNDHVLQALLNVKLSEIQSRKEAEDSLAQLIPDAGTKQFLLKNLYRDDKSNYAWRFHLSSIAANSNLIGNTFNTGTSPCTLPTLFLRGEHSEYINEKDVEEIKRKYPNGEVKTIPAAGHWLHADQPAAFYKAVMDFVNKP